MHLPHDDLENQNYAEYTHRFARDHQQTSRQRMKSGYDMDVCPLPLVGEQWCGCTILSGGRDYRPSSAGRERGYMLC